MSLVMTPLTPLHTDSPLGPAGGRVPDLYTTPSGGDGGAPRPPQRLPRQHWSACPPVNRHHRPRFSAIHLAVAATGGGAGAGVVKTGPLVSEREAATMRFVRAHTSIPVPEVYGCWRDDDDDDESHSFSSSSSSSSAAALPPPSGDCCIFMEHVEGDLLADVYDTLPAEARVAVAEQLRGYVAQLRALPRARRIMAVDGHPARDPMFHGRRRRRREQAAGSGEITSKKKAKGPSGLSADGAGAVVDMDVDMDSYGVPVAEDDIDDDNNSDYDDGYEDVQNSDGEPETLTNHQQVYDREADFRRDFARWFLRRQNCRSSADLEAVMDGLLAPDAGEDEADEDQDMEDGAAPSSARRTQKQQQQQQQPLHPSSFVFTHGNLTPRNVVVRGAQVVAVLDWSQAGYYPAYWEYTKMRCCDTEEQFVRDGMPEYLVPHPESDDHEEAEGRRYYSIAAEAFGAAYSEIY